MHLGGARLTQTHLLTQQPAESLVQLRVCDTLHPDRADLDSLGAACVHSHAHSKALEQHRVVLRWVWRVEQPRIRLGEQLVRPAQAEQLVLHLQGPGDGVYGVMEGHGEGIPLCCHL